MSNRINNRARDIALAKIDKKQVLNGSQHTPVESRNRKTINLNSSIYNKSIERYHELASNITKNINNNDLERIKKYLLQDYQKYKLIHQDFVSNIKPNISLNADECFKCEKLLRNAIVSVERLSTDNNKELIHNALKEVNAAAHALLFLYVTEMELSRAKTQLLQQENEKLTLSLRLRLEIEVSPDNQGKTLTKQELQNLRDQVREMVNFEAPREGIPRYGGKPIHGAAIDFFLTHYKPYVVSGQEVIFAPDLGWIDERLLTAIRNECRAGSVSPIGRKELLTQALIDGRFTDGKRTKSRVWSAKTYRKRHDLQQTQPEGRAY